LLNPEDVTVEAMEPCQPAGIFTLLSVRNNQPQRAV
jgi:hypothetical protein